MSATKADSHGLSNCLVRKYQPAWWSLFRLIRVPAILVFVDGFRGCQIRHVDSNAVQGLGDVSRGDCLCDALKIDEGDGEDLARMACRGVDGLETLERWVDDRR